ncbi:MAG TPA: hypothetical protein VJ723_10150, partial [Candidatus Angelobacter sp.]|nr:hypothetical protein [Candidatus Angelobacter sp.]
MPLSETESQIDHNGSRGLPATGVRRSYLLGAANVLWLRRGAIGVWLLIGLAISAALGYRIGKYEATTQLMPPDSSSSSGMAGLAPLLARVSGASGFAG